MANFYGRTGIEVKGDLVERLQDLASGVRDAASAAVAAGGEVIRKQAYDYANVSPGVEGHGVGGAHMRDEIKVDLYQYETGVSARIWIDMGIIPYAAHQEFGPHGNAFMRRAIDDTRDQVHESIRSTFSAAIGEGGKYSTKVRFRRYA